MCESRRRLLVELSKNAQMVLVAGARDAEPVQGLTHGFYKYPARFSPAFVRAAIQAFTKPGDLCLDPHVGGGTTLVEALAAGRNAIGVCPDTLGRITEFSEHEANGSETQEGERFAVEVLPIFGQASATIEPGDGAFDDPALGYDLKADGAIGSLDDLDVQVRENLVLDAL